MPTIKDRPLLAIIAATRRPPINEIGLNFKEKSINSPKTGSLAGGEEERGLVHGLVVKSDVAA